MFSRTGIEDGQRGGCGAACQGRTATSSSNDQGVTRDDLVRLNTDSWTNVTLPIALLLMDPVEYPSFSRFDETMGFTSVVSNPKAAFMAANGLVHRTGRKKKSGGAPVLVLVDTVMVGGRWRRRVV